MDPRLRPRALANYLESLEHTAELHVTVLIIEETVEVPQGTHQSTVLMEEADPNEPGLLAHKYYVRDIGSVREVTVRGGTESLRLVSIRNLAR